MINKDDSFIYLDEGLRDEDGEFTIEKYDVFKVKEIDEMVRTLKVEVRDVNGVKKFDDLMTTTFELIESEFFEKLEDNYETSRI